MYADKLCKPIASLAEVKDQPITTIYLFKISLFHPVSTSLLTSYRIDSVDDRRPTTSSGF